MNFDDQDWDAEEAPARNPRDRSTGWKIAAGVVVGIVLGGTLVYALEHRLPSAALFDGLRAPDAKPRAVEWPAERAQPALPRAAADPVDAAASDGQAGQASAVERQPAAEVRQRAAPEQARGDAQASQREAQLAAARKERAWASFYTKPAACDDNPTRTTMVECANHYIRAKRRFEELYAPGKAGPARCACPGACCAAP